MNEIQERVKHIVDFIMLEAERIQASDDTLDRAIENNIGGIVIDHMIKDNARLHARFNSAINSMYNAMMTELRKGKW